MVFQNFWRVPAAWFKLCHYAKHTNKYEEMTKWQHIQYILKLAVTSGNIDFECHGLENIPKENGFLLYGNHQGLFDIVAIGATCPNPLAAVLKKELKGVPFVEQIRLCTNSFLMDREDLRQSMTVINNVIKEVKAGRNYLIFPEGTRSRKGNESILRRNCSDGCQKRYFEKDVTCIYTYRTKHNQSRLKGFDSKRLSFVRVPVSITKGV
jgi:1-acyl-sn-glycerol-3-phosphate acyltransferase